MKILVLEGNDNTPWTRTRPGCRGLVLREDRLLLSYETKTGLWMIPGGGLEDGEDEGECCAREVAEETGVLIRPTACVLEIREYRDDWKLVNKYFTAEVAGYGEAKRTEREQSAGMEPRWVTLEEALAAFSGAGDCAYPERFWRSLYRREYAALREWKAMERPER